jgi:ribosomal protein S18 acetylase RimI-like enzyme
VIVSYESNDQKSLYLCYLRYVEEDCVFVPLEQNDFFDILNLSMTFLSINQQKINGFIMSHHKNNDAYITMLYGNEKVKLDLLNSLVAHLRTMNINTIWVHFFNPVSLSWYPIKGIIHPCYQGEIKDSPMHLLYTNFGFKVHSIQDTFYMNLTSYQKDRLIQEIIEEHKLKGISYEIYNKNSHTGLIHFLDQINAPHWKNTLLENECRKNPLPLLVALDKNVVIGFAGPLMVEKSGRGYFAGIGILEAYRNHKIGKILFLELVSRLKEMNASYMTLFTGRENKARHIYMGAGFEIVKSFVTLKMHI